MIRIHKSVNIPSILANEGVVETNILKANYTASPDDYKSRVGVLVRDITKITVDRDIYADSTVKAQVKFDQHDKCCFCEAKFTDNGYGDVEHFRPKKAYRKRGVRRRTYPGYYWLVYDWNNLMFSCDKCNRSYKKNDFPLGNEATRKLSHNHPNNLNNEDRLLINPLIEEPSDFITFNEEVPVPVNGSLKGDMSITTYGLKRMNNTRLEYLVLLDAILAYYNIDTTDNEQVQNAMNGLKCSRQKVLNLVANANQFYNNAAKDTAKFAHCVRKQFPHLPTI